MARKVTKCEMSKAIEKESPRRREPAGGGAEINGGEPLLQHDCIKPHPSAQYIWENTHLADTYQARAAYWFAKAIEAESLARLEELGETLGGDDGA